MNRGVGRISLSRAEGRWEGKLLAGGVWPAVVQRGEIAQRPHAERWKGVAGGNRRFSPEANPRQPYFPVSRPLRILTLTVDHVSRVEGLLGGSWGAPHPTRGGTSGFALSLGGISCFVFFFLEKWVFAGPRERWGSL